MFRKVSFQNGKVYIPDTSGYAQTPNCSFARWIAKWIQQAYYITWDVLMLSAVIHSMNIKTYLKFSYHF